MELQFQPKQSAKQHINHARGVTPPEMPAASTASVSGMAEKTVDTWLTTNGLGQYAQAIKAAGYHSIRFVQAAGVEDVDELIADIGMDRSHSEVLLAAWRELTNGPLPLAVRNPSWSVTGTPAEQTVDAAEDRRRAEAARAQEREGYEAQLAEVREQAKQDAREREQEWKSREAILTAKVAALQEALSRTQIALEQQVLMRLDEGRVRVSPSSSSCKPQPIMATQRVEKRMPTPDVFEQATAKAGYAGETGKPNYSMRPVAERQGTAAGAIHRQTRSPLSLVAAEPPVLPLHMQRSRPMATPKATTSAPAQFVSPNGRRAARIPGGGDKRTRLGTSGVVQHLALSPVSTSSSPESTAEAKPADGTPLRSGWRSSGSPATNSFPVQASQLSASVGMGGLKAAALGLGYTEVAHASGMPEPPRSPEPSATAHVLGLPPRTVPAQAALRSAPDAEETTPIAQRVTGRVGHYMSLSGEAVRRDSGSHTPQGARAVPVAATARIDTRPPPLPPRMRRMLAAGGSGTAGTRAKSWLQVGTHRSERLVGSAQLYCVLLLDAPDVPRASELDLPQPSGPFSLHEMANMIYAEEVTDSTPLWAIEIGSWQRCGDCVARFSWPRPVVEDRSPLAGGRVLDVAHVHERLSPLARTAHVARDGAEDAGSPISHVVAARKLIQAAEQLEADVSTLRLEAESSSNPEPEPGPEPGQPRPKPEPELEPEPEPGAQ